MTNSIFNDIKTGFTKSEFKNHLERYGGYSGMENEYKEYFNGVNFTKSDIKSCLANSDKCRYSDIFCLDKTRVQLSNKKFIHANLVDGFKIKNKYILCQGPLKNTAEDFIEMIVTYKVPIIVMTTRVLEQGREKCFKYWPDKGSLKISNYEISTVGSKVQEGSMTITELLVNNTKNASVKSKFYHVHFLNWPDHGVPERTDEFNNLVNKVNMLDAQFNSNHNPIIVHCSAGIGRTGTFVLISLVRELYDTKNVVNIRDMLYLLRQQRLHCVQTGSQYQFCYQAINEYLGF